MKTGEDGWVCATSKEKTDDVNNIKWNESAFDSVFICRTVIITSKQVVAPKGFELIL